MKDTCRVCDSKTRYLANAVVLGKYDVQYSQCTHCNFVQTEEPYWLDEAYQDAIIPTDVGLVQRNLKNSRISSLLLRYVIRSGNHHVDYGGGYGMFTRMMRDRGHDFRHQDPHCINLFAKGFEAKEQEETFSLLTAFEVWEHMAFPQDEISKMDQLADHWLISTLPTPDPMPMPGQWWYYALEGGQHVALWSKKALQHVADQYGRNLISSCKGLHLFSRGNVNMTIAKQILRGRFAGALDRFRRVKALTQQDYHKALEATQHVQEQIDGIAA